MKKEPFLVTMPNKDKVVHFIFYFIFVICWTKAVKRVTIKEQIIIVCVAVFYGIIIEVLQSVCTASRQADVFDAITNATGALTAFIFLRFYKNKS